MGATGTMLPTMEPGRGSKAMFQQAALFSQLSELILIKEKIQCFTKTCVLLRKFLPKP